jgi:hypothetical protein
MGSSYQELYCDESATHGSGGFYFGALICSPVRAMILREGLKKVRVNNNCKREMKWTKVSQKMLSAYKAFVDVFFDDPFAYFRILNVIRDVTWRDWAPNEEQRFFKSYYVFLRRTMRPLCRYGVYLDYKPGKPYQWDKLHFAINAAARRDYELRQKHIHTLKAINSKQEDLLQLADLLLGATNSSATASAKVELATHVRRRSKETTRSGKQKVKVADWTPTHAQN